MLKDGWWVFVGGAASALALCLIGLGLYRVLSGVETPHSTAIVGRPGIIYSTVGDDISGLDGLKKAKEGSNKRNLFVSMQRRVLTPKEMKEAYDYGDDLNVRMGEFYDRLDKQKELNEAWLQLRCFCMLGIPLMDKQKELNEAWLQQWRLRHACDGFSDSLNQLTQFLNTNNTNISDDVKKDFLIMESRLNRQKTIGNVSNSYQLAIQAKLIAPNDSSTLLNFAVAALQYAGVLREKALTDSKNKTDLLIRASNALKEALIATQKIVDSKPEPDLLAQAFNTMGRVQYLDGDFKSAESSFKNAYSTSDKAIFHRNRGWALFEGLSGKAHGQNKLDILKDALNEFETSIKEGDDDTVMKNQIPGLNLEIKNQQWRLRHACDGAHVGSSK